MNSLVDKKKNEREKKPALHVYIRDTRKMIHIFDT